jgi:hypothetical protein
VKFAARGAKLFVAKESPRSPGGNWTLFENLGSENGPTGGSADFEVRENAHQNGRTFSLGLENSPGILRVLCASAVNGLAFSVLSVAFLGVLCV